MKGQNDEPVFLYYQPEPLPPHIFCMPNQVQEGFPQWIPTCEFSIASWKGLNAGPREITTSGRCSTPCGTQLQWPQNMLPAGTSHPDSTLGATSPSLCLLIATWVALNSAFSVPAASKQALNWGHHVVFQLCCSACGLKCYKVALQAWPWSQLSSLAEEAWEKQSPQDRKQRHCHLQLLVW